VGCISSTTGVLEIRESQTGSGARTYPFAGARFGVGSHTSKILSQRGAIAVGFPKVLKIWRFTHAPPHVFNCDYALGNSFRVGGTPYMVLATPSPGGATGLYLANLAEKESKKQAVSQRVVPRTYANVIACPSGEFCVFEKMAYRVGKTGLEQVWAKEGSDAAEGYWAMHPIDHRIWTGQKVLEFSSGRVLSTVRDRKGLEIAGSRSVWVGSDRVAELGYNEGGKRRISLWDVESGELKASVEAAGATYLCTSPDGLHLAESGLDKRVRIRNAQTLEVEREFRCHESALTGVAWHPSLPLLVTQSGDGVIRVWNTENFQMVEELMSGPHSGQGPSFRVEVTLDGSELNVYRDITSFFVFRPESFQTAKPSK
jgi:hypothetical protein